MKRLLATLIIVIMLISQLAIVVNASQVEGLTEKTKITSQLKEKMDSAGEGEYIPIYIWLNSHGDFVVYEALTRTYSERINADNEQMFIDDRTQKSFEELKTEVTKVDKEESQDSINTKFDKKKKRIKENTELGSKLSDSQIERFLENEDEQREIVANVEQTQYISEWRSARYNINQFINREFEKRLNMEKCRNVNLDIQLAFVELEATTDYIYELETLDMVESIGLLFFEKGTICDEEVYNQTETDATASNSPEHHMLVDSEMQQYDGMGVKIGVLEGAKQVNGQYAIGINNSNPHLSNKINTGKFVIFEQLWSGVSNTSINSMPAHAESVLSILCGNVVSANDSRYSGIVPNAEIYYSSVRNFTDIKKSLYWCANNGVEAINMSFGLSDGPEEYDRYIDCFITQFRVVVVKSAGNKDNNSNITSPGYAYNSITVGNMTLRTDDDGKYIINGNSCYIEEEHLANKPDICAVGTNICMVNNQGNLENLGSGTSAAAPMVTGTIAKMIQANSQLIGNPDTIKTILLNTASSNVSTTDNGYAETNSFVVNNEVVSAEQGLREKTGAGLLNISAAVNNSLNIGQIYNFAILETDDNKKTSQYYFNAGDTIRATLVFEKNHYEIISGWNDIITNINLYVKNSSGELVLTVDSVCNNVDSINITFLEDGYYYFEIANESTEFDNGTQMELVDASGQRIGTYYPLSYINATFMFTCGCSEPTLQETYKDVNQHKISCSRCGFVCEKKHNLCTYRASLDNGSIRFYAVYLYKTPISATFYEFYYFDFRISSTKTNSSDNIQVTLSSTDEYVVYGNLIDDRVYNVVVTSADGTVKETKSISIKITKNRGTGVATITMN